MRIIIALLALIGSGISCAQAAPSNNTADWFIDPATGVTTWIAPNEAAIPNDATGNMIRYGKLLLTETYKYLGAESNMPYSGNRISCSNCHMDTGTAAFGAPWAVVWFKYGAGGQGPYSSRSNRYLDMNNRIHDCMQRSMHGTPLPNGSYELNSMIEYMKWLSTGMQVADWTKVVGQGSISVKEMTRPADPVRGKVVYEDQCAACHQSDGGGVWDPAGKKYVYPAVWGPNSFNNGAGMYRIRTAVGFIKGNMPYGWANASDARAQLSDADAWDVMAYVIANDRPLWAGYLTDWTEYTPSNCMPNWMRKTVDAGYPNYFPRLKPDGSLTGDTAYPAKYTAEKHKYGPWADMTAEQNALQAQYLAAPNTPPNCQIWP